MPADIKKNRHVLARAREAIDMTQAELATLVGCSLGTIKYVELGRLRLSESLAHRINRAIGVGFRTLLANDPNETLANGEGKPYSRADFEAQQASIRNPKEDEVFEKLQQMMIRSASELRDLMAAAERQGQLGLLEYKLWETFQALHREFPSGSHGRAYPEESNESQVHSLNRSTVKLFSSILDSLILEVATHKPRRLTEGVAKPQNKSK